MASNCKYGRLPSVEASAVAGHSPLHAAVRQGVRQCLWKTGIDVGTLFPFPSYLSANDFPNTKNVTSEILNLPLDPGLTLDEIDRISEQVLEAVGRFEAKHEPVLLESSHD